MKILSEIYNLPLYESLRVSHIVDKGNSEEDGKVIASIWESLVIYRRSIDNLALSPLHE